MERAYWLAWTKISGIGAVLQKRIYQRFGSLQQTWEADAASLRTDLRTVEGLRAQVIEDFLAARSQIDPLALLSEYERHNPRFWTPDDPDYPGLLWEIPDPPPILHYFGSQMSWSEHSTVAIVGTRNPSSYGRRWARKIAQALAERGFVVVSGLAEGVDAEAHQGCLDVKGTTIAVVGTGVDRVYPARHQALYQQIVDTGLVISEYANGTPPDRMHFPQRNRIIAGLARATIVIEAPERSGALITAHQANEYGRDVFALPGSLDAPQSRGCLELIARGAQIIMGIDELLSALGSMPQLDPPSARASTLISSSSLPLIHPQFNQQLKLQIETLEPIQQQVLAVLSHNELTGFDQIVEQLNLPSGEVVGALLHLELLGAIAQSAGMRYQRLN